MDLQQAINEPRAIFTSYSAPLKVYAEPRLPEETIQALIDAGYEVDSGKDWNTSLGSVGRGPGGPGRRLCLCGRR